MKLAILIASRNRPDLVDRMVEYLEANVRVEKTIIVVECGTEPSKLSKHSTLRYDDDDFRGKCFGHVKALEHARSLDDFDYYWVLMNDLVFEEGTDPANLLIETMERHPRLGILSPTCEDGLYPSSGPRNQTGFRPVTTCDYLGFMIRREAIRDAGFLNPAFTYCWGAIHELAFKLYSQGWSVAYSDDVTYQHLGGSTYGAKDTKTISREEYQSRAKRFAYLYFLKNYGPDWPQKFWEATKGHRIEKDTFSLHHALWSEAFSASELQWLDGWAQNSSESPTATLESDDYVLLTVTNRAGETSPSLRQYLRDIPWRLFEAEPPLGTPAVIPPENRGSYVAAQEWAYNITQNDRVQRLVVFLTHDFTSASETPIQDFVREALQEESAGILFPIVGESSGQHPPPFFALRATCVDQVGFPNPRLPLGFGAFEEFVHKSMKAGFRVAHIGGGRVTSTGRAFWEVTPTDTETEEALRAVARYFVETWGKQWDRDFAGPDAPEATIALWNSIRSSWESTLPASEVASLHPQPKGENSTEDLQAKIDELNPWYYPVHVGGIPVTPGVGSKQSPEQLSSRVDYRTPLLVDEVCRQYDFRGKSLLDLASNCAYWSARYAEKGATSLYAVEGRETYRQQGELYWDHNDFLPKGSYKFTLGNVLSEETWKGIEGHGPFDFTLVCGILYHIPDYDSLLKNVAAITREAVLIDTRVADEEELTEEPGGWFFDAITETRRKTVPNLQKLTSLMASLGFEVEPLSIEAETPIGLLGPDDYNQGKRIALLARRVRSIPTHRESRSTPIATTPRKETQTPPKERPISFVQVELTNHCNYRCHFCPQSVWRDPAHSEVPFERDKGFMDFDLYRKVLSQAYDCANEVNFSFFGEPMMHPRFLEYFEELRHRPEGVRVVMNTNLSFATKEIFDKLIDIEIDELRMSLDAATETTYELVRPGRSWVGLNGEKQPATRFATICAKAEHWFQRPDHRPTRHVFTTSSRNAHEFSDFVRRWQPLLGNEDMILGKNVLTYGGKMADSRIHANPCNVWKLNALTVDWTGRVSPCNLDTNMDLTIGRIQDSTLLEIHESEARKRIETLSKERAIRPCKTCIDANNWSKNIRIRREDSIPALPPLELEHG